MELVNVLVQSGMVEESMHVEESDLLAQETENERSDRFPRRWHRLDRRR